ncbi:hypothetical protein [Nocardia salmonicida]|uniref:hypothetical protein n=1 Tax=Nocardia salmonicida TaxID=53431 RepID=UPI000A7D598F|nr:hypothetical protein [Nocardia salmonicida]
MRRLVVACVILLVPGCASFVDEGTSNDAIKESTGLLVPEASQIVADNFELISPNPRSVDIGEVKLGNGCRTDPNTLKSYGPPWTPHYQEVVLNPPSEFIDRAVANIEAMTTRGFVRREGMPGEDPVGRVYTDSRGFTVYVARDRTVRGEVEFTLFSSSPCAAE